MLVDRQWVGIIDSLLIIYIESILPSFQNMIRSMHLSKSFVCAFPAAQGTAHLLRWLTMLALLASRTASSCVGGPS
jgi:hypothetical protein